MFIAKTVAATLALAGVVSAAPVVEKRNNDSGKSAINDGVILNYALTLEHLEAAFYKEALNMYNAGAFSDASFPDYVRFRFTEIANHEGTHVAALSGALTAAGITPVKACSYDFGITSVETFLATSQILEGVGVSAYLGAAPFITEDAYLTVAGSILVVETQHEAWVRSAADNMDAFPRAFAAGLQFNQVYTLASPFITSCPKDNPALPVKAFPSIKLDTMGPYSAGQKLTIEVSKDSGAKYAAFVATVGTTYQEVKAGSNTITIPDYATGQSYLILTSSMASTDAATVAGPSIIYVPVEATTFSY